MSTALQSPIPPIPQVISQNKEDREAYLDYHLGIFEVLVRGLRWGLPEFAQPSVQTSSQAPIKTECELVSTSDCSYGRDWEEIRLLGV